VQLPPSVEDLRGRLDAALVEAVDDQVARLVGIHPDLELLATELEGFIRAGGKRLRPLLVALGWQAAGGEALEEMIGPALAVEFVHTCALVHDDVIDGAGSRRGRVSAHVSLARSAGAWGDGAAERFGVSAAILLGDLALVIADDLFSAAAGTPGYTRAFEAYTTMRVEVTAGQFLDIVTAARRTTSTDLALTVAEYKSGRYSVARPLEVGALLVAGDRKVAHGLVRVGTPLGIAFQLRDDLLGVFGTEATTGKSTVSDLAEGKRTFLVATTLSRLSAGERERFERLFGSPGMDAEAAEELRAAIEATGARTATEQRIRELVEEAEAALDTLRLPASSVDALRGISRYVAARDS
jgi:geranylgeranyl diphosphate synthase, type I